MGMRAPASAEERRFRTVALLVTATSLVALVLLLPWWSQDSRATVTGAALVLGGVAGTFSAYRRARRSPDAVAARPWWLLASAGPVAIIGNLWVAATGSDVTSSDDPSLVANVSVAVALLLSIGGILAFPTARRRGADLVVMVLDGLVAGGAFLLIASVLVFSSLLDNGTQTTGQDRVFGIAFPVLDVLLATVAVLLVVRASRNHRTLFVLIAVAFLLYAGSDLNYAVRSNEGHAVYGTVLDLGWIVGYLLMSLAAWTPLAPPVAARSREDGTEDLEDGSPFADAIGTTLVILALVLATVVQVLFGNSGSLEGPQSALWVILVVAAGARQVLLTVDNNRLRRDLERRVVERTADVRRLARQNEVLVTSVGDGVYGVDHQGRISFVNPSAAAALGWPADELEGRRAHETFHGPDEDGAPYPWSGCYIHEAITHGQVATAEPDDYVRADGSTFPVEITASPLLDDDQIRGAVVTFRDVTQRREVDRMKDEFLSVVSHELRTPLTSIRGSLGLLAGGRMGELPDRAKTLVNVAVQSTERLTRLINDLLDIERMQSGSRPMETAVLDAAALLDTAIGQVGGLAASAGVSLEVAFAKGRVLADEDQVIQTLLNLVGNAVKFSERGSVVTLDAAPEGEEVHFRVIDHGRGIPAEKLESVFERFAQVDSSDTRQKGGTGLGLTISRAIVERHGGRIWAESEFGFGTTVHFTLPAVVRMGAATRTAPEPSPDATSVLICDDDPLVVEQFAEMLRHHGYRPIAATDGQSAVELARREHPRAVVLDLVMPHTTGAQVLSRLRADPVTHDVPVVVISGLGPEADDQVADEAQEWLIKPVSEERLVQAIAAAVDGDHAGRTVLLVEDDEQLAQVVSTLLRDEGLTVNRAGSAAEAVQAAGGAPPDVIVLDVRLPDGSGSDVVAAFGRRWPLARTAVVVYSAVDVDLDQREDLQLGTTVFLTKGRSTPQQVRDEVLALMGAVTSGPPPPSPRLREDPHAGDRD